MSVEERLELFSREYWDKESIQAWYGIDISDDSVRGTSWKDFLVAQGKTKNGTGVMLYSRYAIEKVLQDNSLLCVNDLAARLSMMPDEFGRVATHIRSNIASLQENHNFSAKLFEAVAPNVYLKADIERHIFEAIGYRRGGNYLTFIRKMRAWLRENNLDEGIPWKVQEEPYGYFRDALTDELIPLGENVSLRSEKLSLLLSLEWCSRKTYAANEAILRDKADFPQTNFESEERDISPAAGGEANTIR